MEPVEWSAFELAAPELAGTGRRLIEGEHLAFLATLRRDGAPRLHPVSPVFAGDGIYLAIPPRSPKQHDLRRDGRYALHAPLGTDDEEFVINGVAKLDATEATLALVRQASSHTIRETDVIVELLIERCHWGIWEFVGQPNTQPIYRRWPGQV